jgi:HD-like signal output (HDOD) protein
MQAPLTSETVVAKLEELPSLPAIVYELSQVVNNPMSSTSDVEKLMANDIALTTRVLKLVNSAYYAIPGGVSSLARAIAYIGFDTVNQLVLSSSILDTLAVKGPQRFDWNEFWKHSIGTAIAAETIAKYTHHPTPSDLFTAGLVHDIGKVALHLVSHEDFHKVVKLAQSGQVTYSESETVLHLPPHTEIGWALADKWRLPDSIKWSILHHHAKDHSARPGLNAVAHRNVDMVLLANLFTHALKFGNSGHTKIAGIPRDLMERLALHPDSDLKKLLQETKDHLDKAADLTRVLTGGRK